MVKLNLDNLKFTEAVHEQSDQIAALVNSAYKGDRITVEKIRGIINSGVRVIILAVIDGKIIGCVRLLKKEHTCWLGLLSVDVNYQALGIGRKLIESGEEYAKEVFKCDEMKLEVIDIRKELIGYYQRRGYLLTGERKSLIADAASSNPEIHNLYTVVFAKKL